MSEDPTQGDGRRMAVIVILTLWLMAFALSFVLFLTTESTGDGFLRGANRVSLFLGWQAIAALLSLAAFGVSRALVGAAGLRRAAVPPLVVSAFVIAAFFGALAWGLWG